MIDPRRLRRSLAVALLLGTAGLPGGCTGPSGFEIEPPSVPARRSIRVPQDAPTIQGGIDAARDRDTVLVGDGVYRGPGNRDIDFHGKSIVLRSTAGAARTIIDCEGEPGEWHSGFHFTKGEDGAVVQGFTIRGGYSNHGGAIYCLSTSPAIRGCVLAGNRATVSGGALRCKYASPRLEGCTIAGNEAPVGAGIMVIGRSSPTLRACIIAFSKEGGAIFSGDSSSRPRLRCSNLYGNEGGDWAGRIADQSAAGGNLNLDPLFCDPASRDFRLRADSPCAPENNACGVRIGALDPGCR